LSMAKRRGLLVSALASSVRSFSVRLMALSRKALSCCSSWRRMCRTWRFRASFRLGVLIVAGVSSIVVGGSVLPLEVEVNAM
jgi:hypothetical protein